MSIFINFLTKNYARMIKELDIMCAEHSEVQCRQQLWATAQLDENLPTLSRINIFSVVKSLIRNLAYRSNRLQIQETGHWS